MTDSSRSEKGYANVQTLKLLAGSGDLADRTNPDKQTTNTHSSTEYFKSAQWSADGTCVITNSADNHIRTYVIPPDLLEERPEPLLLQPYSEIISHDSIDAVVPYPRFDLQDVASTLVLSAVNEHPIRLHSVLMTDLVASYPLINPTTEAYIKPHCLTFVPDGSHFIAGSDSLISTFDLSRPGQEPVSALATGPKNNKATWHNPGMSTRGLVSALAIDQQYNVLATGTLTRNVGLYDKNGQGECVGVFSVQHTAADQTIGGQGVTQVIWSPCGRYLYIVERKSDGILMYDIRKTGQLLGWLEGRNANTNQRLQVDLTITGDRTGHAIWAGGTDGLARSWSDPCHNEGQITCDAKYLVHHDLVNSSMLHPSGTVLVTASGQRHFPYHNGPKRGKAEDIEPASMKLWAIE